MLFRKADNDDSFCMKHATEEEYWATKEKMEKTAMFTHLFLKAITILIISFLLRFIW